MNQKIKKSKKILVTHNGSFHTDDIFAAATLSILLTKKGEQYEIIRTRDPESIKIGDYVFDVGGVYDEASNRFDHHQIGGAGKGPEGIEYSSFGLVWKKFGTEVCENEKAAQIIEKKLVAPVDAHDNGMDLVKNIYDVSLYAIQYFFFSMVPTWREENLSKDEMFLQSVDIAKVVLAREIAQAKDNIIAQEAIIEIYKNTTDKKILIFDKDYPSAEVLHSFPETLFVVYPRSTDNTWGVKAVRGDTTSFKNRKNLPASWGGLKDEELQKVTGVSDAVFCHRVLFMCVAKTKEGAIKLAQIAVESKE